MYNRMVVSMQVALQHTIDFDRVFGALADGTRRDIVRRAIGDNEGVAELAAHYPMSFAAVQKHVAILERAGLVAKHRIGRRKVIRTELEALRTAQGLLRRYEDIWRERFDRMSLLIDESKEKDR
jgi:DNA-binding transcriptional ArsR family regulator